MGYHNYPKKIKAPKKIKKEIEAVTPEPVGRPKKVVDLEIAENMAKILCTAEEIAATLNIDADTLNSRIQAEYDCNFSEWYKRFSQGGKASLRRSMWKMVVDNDNPSCSMAIWLSKQTLGMRDSFEEERPKVMPVFIEYHGKTIELSTTTERKEIDNGKETSTENAKITETKMLTE